LKVTIDEGQGRGGRGRNTYRGRGYGRGHGFINKAIIECYRCHKLGHYKYECPTWEVNYVEADEELLLMSLVDMNEVKRGDVWFLDSGCSNHMSGDAEKFCELNRGFKQQVKLGNNTRISVEGKGKIKLKLNGMNHIITDVFYVPELHNNLLSVGQIQEKGLAFLFHVGMCKIYHPKRGMIIQTSMSANKMFILLANTQERNDVCFHTSLPSPNATQQWHSRYGHLSHQGLEILQTKNMVRGLPKLTPTTETCTDCLIGKQHRSSIPKKSTWRATEKLQLQLVHADICGPVTPISNSKKRYFLCFIDDYSRKAWTYFLTEKSESLYVFQCFKKMVEKETGKFINCLRTDRGGEFNSNEFKEFCRHNGIRRQLTTSYTPQQNGVAERKNRTMMNMVRAILSEKKTQNLSGLRQCIGQYTC
jgi:hypothetical protein